VKRFTHRSTKSPQANDGKLATLTRANAPQEVHGG
jgi:hypothetical protein